MNSTENWKSIPGHEGYEISDQGNVRSFRSLNGRGGLQSTPRPLKLCRTPKKNYLRVGFPRPGKTTKYYPVHVLVLTVFKGPKPSPELEGCHNDGNPHNNTISNLRWDTRKANAQDSVLHGTQVRGEKVSLAVLTEDQVREIKAAIPTWKKGMGRQFADKFGVGDSAISAIKKGLSWTHINP